MFRITLAQMRRSLGRLTAAGVAVLIGTAFVAATLLVGDVIRQISTNSITASFGEADLLVNAPAPLDDADMDALRALPGVAAADPQLLVDGIRFSYGDKTISQAVIPLPSSSKLVTQQLTAGELPTANEEVTLPQDAADRLGVGVGDTITVQYYGWAQPADVSAAEQQPTEADEDTGDHTTEPVLATDTVTVTGLTTDPTSAWAQYGGAAQATEHDTLLWGSRIDGNADGAPTLAEAYVNWAKIVLRDGGDESTVRTELIETLSTPDWGTAQVYTRIEAAERTLGGEDGSGLITSVILSFAAVALLVAGLVIANTFQVLVAQRTRTLALLRCVGAVRGQIRRSVLLEAGILGMVASLAGLVVGTTLVQVTLWALQRADLPFPTPSRVAVTMASAVIPLVAGVLVTVVAALTPARVATRVAPIAALRPVDAPAARSKAGRVRLAVSLVLIIGGVIALIGGVAMTDTQSSLAGVGIAILGGATSFVGLLISAAFWMPKVVAGVGSLVGRLGMPARLAAANTGRNPARTAATSTALLIGVTLVAMMSTGAISARTTLDRALDSRYRVDVQVGGDPVFAQSGTITYPALPSDTMNRLATTAGVSTVVGVNTAELSVHKPGETEGYEVSVTALSLSPADAATVLRDQAVSDALAADMVVMPSGLARGLAIMDDDQVTVSLPSGGGTVERTARTLDINNWEIYLTSDTAAEIGSTGVTSTAWLRLAEDADPMVVLQELQDSFTDSGLSVTGSAVTRATYQRAIDTVLAVVIGLLAVAVLIALVGVTNTLSLSVIERRRESATLRALGLTRRQLRISLAVEGALIAGVGAIVGALLGLLYGWAGVSALLSSVGQVHLAVPWSDLGLVLGIALVAGMLASVVPSRSAANTPPVAALADA